MNSIGSKVALGALGTVALLAGVVTCSGVRKQLRTKREKAENIRCYEANDEKKWIAEAFTRGDFTKLDRAIAITQNELKEADTAIGAQDDVQFTAVDLLAMVCQYGDGPALNRILDSGLCTTDAHDSQKNTNILHMCCLGCNVLTLRAALELLTPEQLSTFVSERTLSQVKKIKTKIHQNSKHPQMTSRLHRGLLHFYWLSQVPAVTI